MRRLWFATAAVALLLTEIVIALWVHDGFVRPYLGDVLAVIWLWCVGRAIFPQKLPWMPLYVFLVATAVELAQYGQLLTRLGLADNVWLRTLLGTSFSFVDMLCYAVGCALCAGIDWLLKRKEP